MKHDSRVTSKPQFQVRIRSRVSAPPNSLGQIKKVLARTVCVSLDAIENRGGGIDPIVPGSHSIRQCGGVGAEVCGVAIRITIRGPKKMKISLR